MKTLKLINRILGMIIIILNVLMIIALFSYMIIMLNCDFGVKLCLILLIVNFFIMRSDLEDMKNETY